MESLLSIAPGRRARSILTYYALEVAAQLR